MVAKILKSSTRKITKTIQRIKREIKNKITIKELTITKEDKGKTLVILTQEEYRHNVNNFIQDNQFTIINNNPTQHYQKVKSKN
jgi:hypothetical protein